MDRWKELTNKALDAAAANPQKYANRNPATMRYPERQAYDKANNVDSFAVTSSPLIDEESLHKQQEKDLNYLLDEIIKCDDEHCPWIDKLFPDTVMLLVATRFPEIMRDLRRCEVVKKPQHECAALWVEGMNRAAPILQDQLERRRAKKDDPLQGYDPMQYKEPFWFTGVGNIWRRIEHGSRKITVKNCHFLRREAEQCVREGKPEHVCQRKRGEALGCEPGCYCPYLRYSIFKCLYQPTQEYQRVHAEKYPTYAEMSDCMQKVPNFINCQRGFVPQIADQV